MLCARSEELLARVIGGSISLCIFEGSSIVNCSYMCMHVPRTYTH